ncbi:MAG TPA: DNA-binding response regulator [Cytophagales bacterium]|nr:DNA-binding response regulator [Cytophagales bacterium]HAA23512.1 DNA-binding response regulator [Cytophagales bacterium]HAP60607.1 DNA-binding response regulator [Cytophagales bacterium]
MSKIHILIVEDNPEEAAELREYLEDKDYTVTAVATTLKDALGYFYAQQPDLVIVDIYLGGSPEGITFAQRLNENEATRRPFLFLTQHASLEVFEQAKLTSPYNYLLKPFNPLELQYAIELAIEKFTGETGQFAVGDGAATAMEHNLFLKRRNSLVKVPFGDVDYVEVEGKYSNLITQRGEFLIQWPLKKLIEKFVPHQFVRVHRNYLVNLRAIQQVHLADQHVILSGERSIPFSQNFKKNLLEKFDVLK